jgi:hypothetical protein
MEAHRDILTSRARQPSVRMQRNTDMEDRILSGTIFVILSVAFGSFGTWALLAAYRTDDRTAWTEQAVQAGLGVIASFIFASLATRLIS